MSYKATDYKFDKILLPDTAAGTNSRSFSVPRGAKVATLFLPNFTVDATVAIHALQPQDSDQSAEVWTLVRVAFFTGAAVAFATMDGIADNQTYTFPVAALGGATLRLVLSAAQSGSAVDSQTAYVVWGFDQ